MAPLAAADPDLRFKERMRGWISFDERDYNSALVAGRRAGNRCSFDGVVEVRDLTRFLRDPEQAANLRGTISCPRLGGRLDVEGGEFHLLMPAPDDRRRRMLYRLFARDADGRPLTLSGFKVVEDDPRNDAWRDTTRLLVRILAGHVSRRSEEDDDPRVVATGVLRVTPLAFMRLVLSMRGGRGRRLSAPLRYQREFVRRLLAVYRGRALPATQFDFPTFSLDGTAFQGRRPGSWHELPGRPSLRRRIVPFAVKDRELNLHHIRGPDTPTRGPVLLICGLAMRANSFYDMPSRTTLVDALVERGYDVWVENWRTSIDFPAQDYTLDRAAAYDHPGAVQKVREETCRDRFDAMAHCMGSASLTMSVLAGLVPELRRVVSSAVSLHIDLALRSRSRLSTLMPLTALVLRGTDPQWAARAPSLAAAGLAGWGRFVRRDYQNPLNAATAYFYGGDAEALWQRANVDDDTLEWLGREFGYAPFSFFRQIRRSARKGHLVPVEGLPELPRKLIERDRNKTPRPPEDTQFTFLAGTRNRFFLPDGQLQTYKHFNDLQPRHHSKIWLDGYSHFDVLIGRRAHRDVFPRIIGALEGNANAPA
jgi:hypothetical protein